MTYHTTFSVIAWMIHFSEEYITFSMTNSVLFGGMLMLSNSGGMAQTKQHMMNWSKGCYNYEYGYGQEER
ncbi:MAG: hypothetical protein M1300_06185 [Epsilonproteobacteria bacterium]|nr:hypothetical protein [Campylobacterota bacterium]